MGNENIFEFGLEQEEEVSGSPLDQAVASDDDDDDWDESEEGADLFESEDEDDEETMFESEESDEFDEESDEFDEESEDAFETVAEGEQDEGSDESEWNTSDVLPEIPVQSNENFDDAEANFSDTGAEMPEMSDALAEEYNTMFSGEEQLEQQLAGIMNTVTISMKEIPVDSVILPKFKKEQRSMTYKGLTGLVSTLPGVVTPIHVMTMEDADDEYLLLDGVRRVFAATKSAKDMINAVIWDFENKEMGRSLSNILGLILNRSQQFSNKELWHSLRVLDAVNNCSPGKIEFLLQLKSGDAMKLKDIMLAEGDDEVLDMREKFLNDELTIEGAYKKLTSIRKKENRLDRDDARELDLQQAIDNINNGVEHGTPSQAKPRLNTDEVLEILEMGAEDVTEQTLDELRSKGDAMREKNGEPHVQEVGKRHPIDPELRKKTFERDGFKCRCCGIGGELYLSILVFHHAVPVFAGGPDTLDNGLTLCANCHLTLHNYVDGLLHGDLSEYSEVEQSNLRNIFKYGNIAIKAAQKMGLKREQVRELDAQSRQHIMPNTNVKANNESYFASRGGQKEDDE